MATPIPAPERWQYALVWTPGPERSTWQLWAISAAGRRTLWDHGELAAQVETPSLHRVLHELYVAAVDAQERSTSTR